MLHFRPRSPMLLLLLLAGASTAVLAGPPQQDRERQAPPERAERAQVERPPVRMASPPPRQERMERQERQFERARPRERAQEALSDDVAWMSAGAVAALRPASREALAAAGFRVQGVPLDAIEAAGGSLRCCVAEVFGGAGA